MKGTKEGFVNLATRAADLVQLIEKRLKKQPYVISAEIKDILEDLYKYAYFFPGYATLISYGMLELSPRFGGM